jgi:hypothetical protein
MLVRSRTMEWPLRCWSDTQRCRVRTLGGVQRGRYGDKAKPPVLEPQLAASRRLGLSSTLARLLCREGRRSAKTKERIAWSAKIAKPLDSVAVRRGDLNSKQIQFDAGGTSSRDRCHGTKGRIFDILS